MKALFCIGFLLLNVLGVAYTQDPKRNSLSLKRVGVSSTGLTQRLEHLASRIRTSLAKQNLTHMTFHKQLHSRIKMHKMRLNRPGIRTTTIPLNNYENYQYTGDITANDHTYTVIFDTGSSWMWLPSVKCASVCLATGINDLFDCNKSATCKIHEGFMKIEYGQGKVAGQIVSQDITVGKDHIKAQDMLLIEAISDLTSLAADGIIGLAPPGKEMKNHTTVLHSMKQQNLIPEVVFSIYLSNKTSSAPSKLTLGGYEEKLLAGKNFTQHPVIIEDFWGIKVDSISIDNKTYKSQVVAAVIDSGTSVLVFDAMTTLLLIQDLNKRPDLKCGVADVIQNRVICVGTHQKPITVSDMPILTFRMKGVDYTMEPELYVLSCGNYDERNVNDTVCVLDLVYMDKLPVVILGDSFMRKYYSLFSEEHNTIGLALAKQFPDVIQSRTRIADTSAGPSESFDLSSAVVYLSLMTLAASIALFAWVAYRRYKSRIVFTPVKREDHTMSSSDVLQVEFSDEVPPALE